MKNKIFLISAIVLIVIFGVSFVFTQVKGVGSVPAPTGFVAVLVPPSKTLEGTSKFGQVNLAWNPGTSTAIAGWSYFRNGIRLGRIVIPAVPDGGLSTAASYTYTVVAYDIFGNDSPHSKSITVYIPSQPVKSPFKVGSRVISNSGMNVYDAFVQKKKILCPNYGGVTGIVTDGPRPYDGYNWLFVKFDSGCSGWVWQDYISPAPLQ